MELNLKWKGKIKCPICDREYDIITNWHLRNHKMNLGVLYGLYPEIEIDNESRKIKLKNVK